MRAEITNHFSDTTDASVSLGSSHKSHLPLEPYHIQLEPTHRHARLPEKSQKSSTHHGGSPFPSPDTYPPKYEHRQVEQRYNASISARRPQSNTGKHHLTFFICCVLISLIGIVNFSNKGNGMFFSRDYATTRLSHIMNSNGIDKGENDEVYYYYDEDEEGEDTVDIDVNNLRGSISGGLDSQHKNNPMVENTVDGLTSENFGGSMIDERIVSRNRNMPMIPNSMNDIKIISNLVYDRAT